MKKITKKVDVARHEEYSNILLIEESVLEEVVGQANEARTAVILAYIGWGLALIFEVLYLFAAAW